MFNRYCTYIIEHRKIYLDDRIFIPNSDSDQRSALSKITAILEEAYESTYHDWYNEIKIADIEKAVKQNKLEQLVKFQQEIPELFTSYRFLRYLLSFVNNQNKSSNAVGNLLIDWLQQAISKEELEKLSYLMEQCGTNWQKLESSSKRGLFFKLVNDTDGQSCSSSANSSSCGPSASSCCATTKGSKLFSASKVSSRGRSKAKKRC